MLALGFYLAGWWHGISKIELLGRQLWKKIEPYSRKFIPVQSLYQAFFLGIFWGWLPCGLVYTLLFWSISFLISINTVTIAGSKCFPLSSIISEKAFSTGHASL